MKRMLLFTVCVFMSGVVSAQSKRNLVDIDKELQETKSTTTAKVLIDQIADVAPQTEEDVAILGQLLDKYPAQGQKALSGVTNPKLSKAVMKECKRQVDKFKSVRNTNWKNLPETQRQENINALMNTHALIAALGNLKNKEALPLLKEYVTPEYDETLSYVASQAIGMIAPEDPVVFRELWNKSKEVENIDYGAYRKSALKEVSERMQDKSLSNMEKTKLLGQAQIELRGASDAEEKKLLKDLVKNHPSGEMRETAGQSLMHSMKDNFEPDDKVYLKQWIGNENEGSVGWALYAVRDHWSAQYIPELLKILKASKWRGSRYDSAEILGQHKVKESIPYLAECVMKDTEKSVRGSCRYSYYEITGVVFPTFVPEDVQSLTDYYNEPLVIKTFSRIKEDDPNQKYNFVLRRAFEAYKQNIAK